MNLVALFAITAAQAGTPAVQPTMPTDVYRFAQCQRLMTAPAYLACRERLCQLEEHGGIVQETRLARQIYQCWDALDNAMIFIDSNKAQCVYELNRIRAIIGDENFFAGRMPTPIYYWVSLKPLPDIEPEKQP